ncbi:DMT family transporter [Bifidobacterium sp. UBA6881]|uniref:DMT family transporter n=1 Tax=Bifidobacterium sp. UBA6881 TaxID=1946109 RepID=UPI000ECA042E|nr:DMT family transporter [Bifidobacterium sp. UBA6881]HCA74526.1 EamA/RhaT family transporter [Bifidobacterium sp.]
MQRKEIGGMTCLVLTAMIWGFAFVSQVQGMDSTTPLFFGATRFTLGAVSLLPLLWFRRDGIARRERARRAAGHGPDVVFGDGRKMTMPAWLGNPVVASVICGVVLFTASTVQQYGILYSGSAGRSGFITALYIVMTPLLAFVVLRRRVHAGVMVSVAISVVGFYLLCVTDGFGSITVADVVLLLTAVLFAGHILIIDTFGRDMDPILLSFGQIATTAALSWIGSLFEGSIDWNGATHSWFAIVYAGVCSAGVAYTLQVVGQQLVPPTRASVIMSLESFFSAVGGVIILGETMTPRACVGCALIFAGTVLAQMPARIPGSRMRRG